LSEAESGEVAGAPDKTSHRERTSDADVVDDGEILDTADVEESVNGQSRPNSTEGSQRKRTAHGAELEDTQRTTKPSTTPQ